MKVIIVGGVAGGATAAARIRRLNEHAEITVFERSGYISYANCGLPYYIGDVITDPEELTLQTPESFFKQADINQEIEEYSSTAGAILLDVRTLQEYQEGHIPESKNMPLQQLNNVVSVVKNKDIPLFVYCYSGARSRQATGMLQHMGYTKVKNIGGIAAYTGKIEK